MQILGTDLLHAGTGQSVQEIGDSSLIALQRQAVLLYICVCLRVEDQAGTMQYPSTDLVQSILLECSKSIR